MGLFTWIRKRQRRQEITVLDTGGGSEDQTITSEQSGPALAVQGDESETDDLILAQTTDGVGLEAEDSSPQLEESTESAAATVALLDEEAVGQVEQDFAAPAASVPEASVPIVEAQMPAEDLKQMRDPIVDELIMSLMDEASKRSDAAVTAYHTLTQTVSAYSTHSQATARRAWAMVGAMTFGIVIGGIWGSYKLGRATSIVENLREQVTTSKAAVAERDQLRTQVSIARAGQFQAELQFRAVQQSEARAQVELEAYRQRSETVDDSARPIGFAPTPALVAAPPPVSPATQPAEPKVQTQAVPATQPGQASADSPRDSWASLLGQ
jgi:hypothetical protein